MCLLVLRPHDLMQRCIGLVGWKTHPHEPIMPMLNPTQTMAPDTFYMLHVVWYRDQVIIASKVAGPSAQMTWIRGGPHKLDGSNVRQAVDDSLLRLQTDYIDLYQLHWPDR
eukprot:GHRR01031688.1.p1 GENE.GHRR01031688.1~~GHRR01031688.1.p1  ORF type:complete len:111 (+),score=16.06 GHRR01031688.1:334-666(+)